MKIKVHSSLKNIKSLIASGWSPELAIHLAASTILDAEYSTPDGHIITNSHDRSCDYCRLNKDQYEIVKED